jgi:phosphate transport system permease protein
VGTEDGRVVLYQLTTEEQLADLDVLGEPTRQISIAPKDDGLMVRGEREVRLLDLDLGFPEASLAALSRPLWYEGYPEPGHVWQSTGSDDGSEPKFGLWPLVFGTLKATLFSMFFGAPLALLAALFCSEFLSPRLRTPVKSTIELMASLPSVVLGFLAAMVFAPFVEEGLPFVLASFLVIPVVVLLGAYLWQLVPHSLALRFGALQKLLLIAGTLPLGLWLSWSFGPLLERACFGGDVMAWLNGRGEGCAGAWAYLSFPLAGTVVFWAVARWVQPLLSSHGSAWERSLVARIDLFKYLSALLLSLVTALAAGLLLEAAGLDPRDSLFGSYDTRNALVVGFVMGFAIIPIIFTLAEDALGEVPSHLREASLGAGATPWQTALRVVVPTAMSGLFSGVMIGLGRAVGETMIVLMAAGSTPILEFNIFNGFRTLSANIATELPEAVHGSAHYRTLFLAALTLFGMTFVLNSVAETVRRHFRKKAVSL